MIDGVGMLGHYAMMKPARLMSGMPGKDKIPEPGWLVQSGDRFVIDPLPDKKRRK